MAIKRPNEYELSLIFNKLKNQRNYEKYKENSEIFLSLEDLAFVFKENDKNQFREKVKRGLTTIQNNLKEDINSENVIDITVLDDDGKYYCTVIGDENKFKKIYPYVEEMIDKRKNIRTSGNSTCVVYDIGNILKINLKEFYKDKESTMSFEKFKRMFFEKTLFQNKEFNVIPRCIVEIDLLEDYEIVLSKLCDYMEFLKSIMRKIKEQRKYIFRQEAEDIIKDNCKHLSKNQYQTTLHILMNILARRPKDSFTAVYKILSIKNDKGQEKISVIGKPEILDEIVNTFKNRFKNSNYFRKYIIPPYKADSYYTQETKDLAYILQILNLGTFRIIGGIMPSLKVTISEK